MSDGLHAESAEIYVHVFHAGNRNQLLSGFSRMRLGGWNPERAAGTAGRVGVSCIFNDGLENRGPVL